MNDKKRSRLDVYEQLVGDDSGDIAPSVSALKAKEKNQDAIPVRKPSPRPAARGADTKSKEAAATPIRCTLSIPQGSKTEEILNSFLESLPGPARRGFNIATVFRQMILNNDDRIAKMLGDELK